MNATSTMRLQQMKSDAPSSIGFGLKNIGKFRAMSKPKMLEYIWVCLKKLLFFLKTSDFLLNHMLICLFETSSM